MLFCLLHLEDTFGRSRAEEVYVVMPDGSKAAFALPIGALPEFLPLLDEATGDGPLPECPTCQSMIPALAHLGR